MRILTKYFTIARIYYSASISRDLAHRVNLLLGMFGAFCFVFLNYFIVTFLFQKITIGSWGRDEILILLGNFYIIWYAIFFFFFRGFLYLIRNIKSGLFDYYLIRPADTQFLVSVIGGGIHNVIAIIFGFGVLVYGVVQFGMLPSIFSIFIWFLTIIVAILDCYAFILLFVTLNFRYGYMEEVINLAFSVQEFSRYPIDAFSRLPMVLFLFILPFSALATIPSLLFISRSFPTIPVLVFLSLSLIFLWVVRKVWLRTLRNYTSSN